ncbi:uncharacterized mitochondrial protein AtMg00810-like [Rhodamnia argentea]|uniref:Uncharacterized mitochondrial protein AtMg00810-like n=1 Tax=Rhodamnia argentea TaxID=178133 RepID=A0A8B8P2G6_9MYRT|nr:uncharacterized mitochondrial protein AtMg00810-like [Rhodamnia argentea]
MPMVVLVYVDDIFITGDNIQEIEALKRYLNVQFDIKDLGHLRYFHGIEVAHYSKGLFICQIKYALDLLKETGKLGAASAKSPMDFNKTFVENITPLPDIGQFQRLVGRLIYLTITRLDIVYAVDYVSQFMHASTEGHMALVDLIL